MKRGSPSRFICLKSRDKRCYEVTHEQAERLGTIAVALKAVGDDSGEFELPSVGGNELAAVVDALNGIEFDSECLDHTIAVLHAANYLAYPRLTAHAAKMVAAAWCKLGKLDHDAYWSIMERVGQHLMMTVVWFFKRKQDVLALQFAFAYVWQNSLTFRRLRKHVNAIASNAFLNVTEDVWAFEVACIQRNVGVSVMLVAFLSLTYANTALFIAATHNNVEAAKALLKKKGVDPLHYNGYVLKIAHSYGYTEMEALFAQ